MSRLLSVACCYDDDSMMFFFAFLREHIACVLRSSANPISTFNVERSSIIIRRKHSLHVFPRRGSMCSCCRNRFCHRIGLNCLRAQACCVRANRAFTREATATTTTGPSIVNGRERYANKCNRRVHS